MHITFFKSKFDNRVSDTGEYTFDELAEFMLVHRKTDQKNDLGFILGKFKTESDALPAKVQGDVSGKVIPGTVGRYAANVLEIDALVLDYDSGKTIPEIKQELSKFRHIGYTSFSHGKNGQDKFRVIIPLKTPCPAAEWKTRFRVLLELFPGVDKTTFSLARMFFAPASNYEVKPESWVNAGPGVTDFDWTEVPEEAHDTYKRLAPRAQGTGKAIHSTINLLSLFQDSGLDPTLANAIDGKYNVRCPNEHEHTAPGKSGTVIWHRGYGRDGFYCAHSHCQGKSVWSMFPPEVLERYCEKTDTLEIKIKDVEPGPNEIQEIEEHTLDKVLNERQFDLPKRNSSTVIPKFISEFSVSPHIHGVLRTPEGFGKSTELVKTLITRGDTVLFCCSSNKQADEKFESFSKLYSDIGRPISKGYYIEREFGVKSAYTENSEGLVVFDEQGTLENLVESGLSVPEAEACIQEAKEQSALSVQQKQLMVTTFAMGNALQERLSCTIIVDDPSFSDIQTVQVEFNSENKPVIKAQKKINETLFAEVSFPKKVIWTTTEKLVLDLIQFNHGRIFIKEIKETLDTFDDVLIHPSHLVRKKLKPVLGLIDAFLKKELPEKWDFIANGINAELNLVSTKGRNDMLNHQVILISYPHPLAVLGAACSLGVPLEDAALAQQELTAQMTVDVLDQALGRAQGYRFKEFEHRKSLVICDPQLELVIRKNSRYKIKTLDGMKRQGRLKNVPVSITHLPFIWSTWITYLNAWEKYVRIIPYKGEDRVICTLNLNFLPDVDIDFIRKLLKQPVKGTDWAWKSIEEIIEVENSRRNIVEKMEVLIKGINQHGNTGVSKPTSKETIKKAHEKNKDTFLLTNGKETLKLKLGEIAPLGYYIKNPRAKVKLDSLNKIVLR